MESPSSSDAPDVQQLDPRVQTLFAYGPVNFEDIAQSITRECIDTATLERLRKVTIHKIHELCIGGRFGDLEGVDALLEKLGINVGLSHSLLERLNKIIPLVGGIYIKHIDETQKNGRDLKIARHNLWATGFFGIKEEDISDETVELILDWRHMLMALNERSSRSITIQELLEELNSQELE